MDLTGLTEKRNRRGTKYFVDCEGENKAKQCTKCNNIKTIDEFSEDRSKFLGRRSDCRSCERRRKTKYRRKTPDYSREHYRNNKEYYKKYYSDNLEKIKKRQKKYYLSNRKEIRKQQREYQAEYYFKNRKQRIESANQWRLSNKEIVNVHHLNRRARKKSLPDTLTKEQRAEILSHFNVRCSLTTSSDYHMDHVIPLATGHGGTIYENMIPLRADLNVSKSDRCIFEWFHEEKERFGLSQQKFDELIEYLADINDMTVEEYEEYVRWCHDNPRSINEIETKKESKEPAS